MFFIRAMSLSLIKPEPDLGEFVVKTVPAAGFGEAELLAAAAAAEHYSNHPIGKAIIAYAQQDVDETRLSNYAEIPW